MREWHRDRYDFAAWAAGYDINPAGEQWLRERGLWHPIYHIARETISLWDVLQHMPGLRVVLKHARQWGVRVPADLQPLGAPLSHGAAIPASRAFVSTAAGLVWCRA